MDNFVAIHADVSQRLVVDQASLPWVDSPVSGVSRRLLERTSAETGRATSIVAYAPGSSFHRHTHGLGEEILVLDGIFSDENGDYGQGCYLKNPPGSAHAPWSEKGCILFVKLHHLDPADQHQVAVDTRTAQWSPGLVPGLTVLPLSTFGTHSAAMVRWAPNTRFQPHRHFGGEEIYVVDGIFEDEHGRYPAGTWMRSPHLSAHQPFSVEGCTIFVKTGHLAPEVAQQSLQKLYA